MEDGAAGANDNGNERKEYYEGNYFGSGGQLSRKKHSSWWHRKNVTVVGIAVLALLASVITVLALTHKAEDVPVSPQVASYYATPRPVQTRALWPTAVFIGDSFTQGAGASSGSLGWAQVASRSLTWVPTISADGASGYLVRGLQGKNTGDLIAAADVEVAPQFIVIASGYNDPARDEDVMKQAIISSFDAAQAKWPDAQLIVVGPWAPTGKTNANKDTVRRLLETSARSEERRVGKECPV